MAVQRMAGTEGLGTLRTRAHLARGMPYARILRHIHGVNASRRQARNSELAGSQQQEQYDEETVHEAKHPGG